MTSFSIELLGSDRGVLVFDSIDPSDCAGIVQRSFDTTSTSSNAFVYAAPLLAPARDFHAILHESADRYDNLLRRLAD